MGKKKVWRYQSGNSEAVNRRWTTQWPKKDKTLHKKLKTEQHKPHKNWVHPWFLEGPCFAHRSSFLCCVFCLFVFILGLVQPVCLNCPFILGLVQPVCLNCPFLIAPSIFCKVYWNCDLSHLTRQLLVLLDTEHTVFHNQV
jgi:hypothetical protein